MARERSARMQMALPVCLREKLLAVKKKTGLPLNEIVDRILKRLTLIQEQKSTALVSNHFVRIGIIQVRS